MAGRNMGLIMVAVCCVASVVGGMAMPAQGKFVEERLADAEARIAALEDESRNVRAEFGRALEQLTGRIEQLELQLAIAETTMPTRLLLHFDEGTGSVAHDSSLYENHGTIHGTEWVEGIHGSALAFDGNDDWVKITSSPSLDIRETITLEAWINPAEDNRHHPIWEYNDGGPSSFPFGIHVWQYQRWSDININLFGRDGTHHILGAPGILTTGWQHLAVVYDGATGRIYRNGELAAEGDLGSFQLQTSHDLYVGHRPSGGGHYFNGVIDEVAIYDTALSPGEIEAHYAAQKAVYME